MTNYLATRSFQTKERLIILKAKMCKVQIHCFAMHGYSKLSPVH